MRYVIAAALMAAIPVIAYLGVQQPEGQPQARRHDSSGGRPDGTPTRGAGELLGKRVSLDKVSILKSPDEIPPGEKPLPMNNRVTLVRWWTDQCPYCAVSLPAVELLRSRFSEKGLQTLAVYHPKPPRNVPGDQVLQIAKAMGYTGPVATDLDWSALRAIIPDIHRRRSSSVTFLLDESGTIRYFHPGPVFGPTDDPAGKEINRDFLDITAMIETCLAGR